MNHAQTHEPVPRKPARDTDRIGGFARYFKRYMAASAVITAALPVPVAAFKLVPAYAEQRSFLGLYTSLFTFLVLAFLFYSRHWIAGSMFAATSPGVYHARPAAAWCPLMFICCSLGTVFGYHAALDASIDARMASFRVINIPVSPQKILSDTSASDVPYATLLISLYLGIFLFAEAAFVMMALREYLQDLLGISDRDLLHHRARRSSRAAAS